MRRALATLVLAASLVLAGCQNPDGSTDWGNTLLLGAGVGVAAALVAGAASDSPQPRRNQGYYRQGYDQQGYQRGYGRSDRGWR
jgi:hypothetical protein